MEELGLGAILVFLHLKSNMVLEIETTREAWNLVLFVDDEDECVALPEL